MERINPTIEKYSYSTIVPNHLVVGVDGKEGKLMEVHPIVLLFASACSEDFFCMSHSASVCHVQRSLFLLREPKV